MLAPPGPVRAPRAMLSGCAVSSTRADALVSTNLTAHA
jgi:hypothetical protein